LSKNNDSLEDHLVSELLKTGYPFEIEICGLLDRDWLVFNNDPYLDEDEGKTREIDILAMHNSEADQYLIEPKSPFFMATDLAVECKKTDTHAWIFFTRQKATPPGFGSGQTLDFLEVFSKGKKNFFEPSDLPKLHYDSFNRIAHTYTEVKLQGEASQKSEIFEASNQLTKYAAYFMHDWNERISNDVSRRDIIFLFVAIAFEGKLYEAIVERGALSLHSRDNILLAVARRSKVKEGFSYYLIDVVTKNHFHKYLEALNKDIEKLRDFVYANEKEFASKAENEVKGFRTFKGSIY